MFTNDWDSGPIIGAQGLDHNGAPNQHARVDILNNGSGLFDTGAGVLQNLFIGQDGGNGTTHPFVHYMFDLTTLLSGGGTFILRFAEVDNQLFFNTGVDNVSIQATDASDVPEPTSMMLLGTGLAGLVARYRRRRQA